MNIFLRLLIAAFAAAQTWAWLRYLGGMLVTGNLNAEYISYLFYGVGPLDLGFKALGFILFPVIYLYYWWLPGKAARTHFIVYVCVGIAWGAIFHLYNWGFIPNKTIAVRMLFVSLSAGVIAGFVLWSILLLPHKRRQLPVTTDSSQPDRQRRMLLSAGAGLGGVSVVTSFIGPARILSHASDYVDIDGSKINEGEMVTAFLLKTPVWIIKRTDRMIQSLAKENPDLYDPHSDRSQQPAAAKNAYRSIDPRYFVVYGVCTHLGCAPKYLPDGNHGSRSLPDFPQIHCPCHNAVFDLAGRVLTGYVAPRNLDIPNYEISGDNIRIYHPSLTEVWSRIP